MVSTSHSPLPSGATVLVLHSPEGSLGLWATGLGDRCGQVRVCARLSHSSLLRNWKGAGSSHPLGGGGVQRDSMGALVPCQSFPCPCNPVCSLSPGSGGRRGTEWNRNSMWGTSPSPPLNQLSSLFSHASLSSCQAAGFSPLQALGGSDGRRRCALRSRGSVQLVLLPTPALSVSRLGETCPSPAPCGPPGEQHHTVLGTVTQRQAGCPQHFHLLMASSSHFKVPCPPWERAAQGAPWSGLCPHCGLCL